MGPVSRSERIIDIHVAQPGKIGGECRLVGLFLKVETQILQKQRVTIMQPFNLGFDFGPHAVVSESDRAAQ